MRWEKRSMQSAYHAIDRQTEKQQQEREFDQLLYGVRILSCSGLAQSFASGVADMVSTANAAVEVVSAGMQQMVWNLAWELSPDAERCRIYEEVLEEIAKNPDRFCAYPCSGCGRKLYYIDLQSPERHQVVRAAACRTLLGRTPKSGEVLKCEGCGQEVRML